MKLNSPRSREGTGNLFSNTRAKDKEKKSKDKDNNNDNEHSPPEENLPEFNRLSEIPSNRQRAHTDASEGDENKKLVDLLLHMNFKREPTHVSGPQR
jgi:hypothetical protein